MGSVQAYTSSNFCCTRVLGLHIAESSFNTSNTEPRCIYIKNEGGRSCKITTETKIHEIGTSNILTKVVGIICIAASAMNFNVNAQQAEELRVSL